MKCHPEIHCANKIVSCPVLLVNLSEVRNHSRLTRDAPKHGCEGNDIAPPPPVDHTLQRSVWLQDLSPRRVITIGGHYRAKSMWQKGRTKIDSGRCGGDTFFAPPAHCYSNQLNKTYTHATRESMIDHKGTLVYTTVYPRN